MSALVVNLAMLSLAAYSAYKLTGNEWAGVAAWVVLWAVLVASRRIGGKG